MTMKPGWIVRALAYCFLSLTCVSAEAQERDRQPAQDTRTPQRSFARLPEQSDLGKENLDRVAASAAQVRQVLAKDPGILVELKRWVAKEATDSGQVVEDASLTDDAIFERLDRDIAFRSLATRLVQRYGYLLPAVNPDSPMAKEEDLIQKERARRFVQIEAQEDAQSLQPKTEKEEGQRETEQRASCDAQLQDDRNCTDRN